MSTETIKAALEERDSAIESKFEEMAQENQKLNEKSMTLADRLVCLEQMGGPEFGEGPPVSKHKFGNVLRALADPRGKIEGYEAEWSQEFVRKTGIDYPGAIWVPLSTKAVDYNSESPTSGGSNLVQTELRNTEFIDYIRQRSVAMQIGPHMLAASDNLDIPVASSGVTGYIVSGDGENVTESEGVFTKQSYFPRYFGGYTRFTYRMSQQSNIEEIVRQDIAAQIATKIDDEIFNGDGTGNRPTGILNTSGINAHTYTSSPTVVQWSDVVELEKLLIEDKVPMIRPAYVAGVDCYKLLKTVSRAGSEAIFLADFAGDGRPTLNGIPLFVTTHMPASQLLLGDFSELLFVTFGAVALMSDPYTDFASGTVGIRGLAPIDVGVRHAESFAVAS